MPDRLPDWEDRLNALAERLANQPHAYGVNDCGLLAGAAAEALTGVNPAAEYVGRYSDRRGAALALREIGSGTLRKTINDLFEPKPVAFAMRGDIVSDGLSLGICFGDYALFIGDEGSVRVRRDKWKEAWRGEGN